MPPPAADLNNNDGSHISKASDDNTMIAFAITQPGNTRGEVIRVPKPKPERPGYALIRVLRAGVCNTDLEILMGYMGFHGVLGHEFVGIVESVNPSLSPSDMNENEQEEEEEERKWVGKRVCGDINVGCSTCSVCTNAHGLNERCSMMSRNHCPNRTVLGILNRNGTMAEYLTLPLSNLHVVPDDMPDDVAVFAEPLAAACRIVEQNLIRYDGPRTDRVAILGDGKLGLMIAEVLGREHAARFGKKANGVISSPPPKPILFGKHQHKMDLVKDSGVECRHVLECRDENSFNGVSSQYSAKYDVVVDATGSPAGLSLASGLCRPMGTLVLKSTCAAGEQFNAAPFVIDELRVIGSRCGPINKALELLSLKETNGDDPSLRPLNVQKYITKTFPLSEANEAIKCAAEKSTMKVQIICSGT